MKPKMIWANFSVKDVHRTNQFYTALGIKPWGRNDNPDLVSFAFGEDEFIIHFFEHNTRIKEYLTANTANASEIIFTLSADTEQEVNEWANQVKKAGGTIFHKVERDKAGYYGFAFADPDGHKFNVLLMEKGM